MEKKPIRQPVHSKGTTPWLPVWLLAVWLGGCATTGEPEPDLQRLYAGMQPVNRHPVVVIPGILGSTLQRSDGTEVWPGGFWNLVSGHRLETLALSITPEGEAEPLTVGDLFHEAVGRDFYRNLTRTLTGPGGYRCLPATRVDAATDCILFAWDWRRDIPAAAASLERLILRLRELRNDPALKVDLVGHSAGGIVARYFVRFGGTNVLESDTAPPPTLAGAAMVDKVILIGTPNYGSVSALQHAINGVPAGLGRIPPEVVATMPSLYQLLPHPRRTWMIDRHGRRLEPDLYAVESWRRFRWSIFDPKVRQKIIGDIGDPMAAAARIEQLEHHFAHQLQRARRFHEALSVPVADTTTRFIVFGGDCHLTPARCLLEEEGEEFRIRLRPDEIANPIVGIDYNRLMLEPGDGTVTKASLLARDSLMPESGNPGFFPLDYVVFNCARHAEMAGNITFRDNLLNILLY